MGRQGLKIRPTMVEKAQEREAADHITSWNRNVFYSISPLCSVQDHSPWGGTSHSQGWSSLFS